ncbi:MAG: oxidoreductase [Bacteroidetes bacterium]|nr:MAG: oxidoreductase [Bacteroidota bacterium]
MVKKQLNTGVIGFGLSGKVFHAPFLHTHPGFNLKKIVERNSTESKNIYPELEVVSDYKNLIKDETLDLIAICTPNTLHFSMVKECLLAGKHVVVEKPFTPTSKEADELIKISEEKERKIFVYHNRRWDGDFLSIKKILKDNLLGDLYEYEVHFDRFTPDLDQNWRDKNIPGGGILYDLGAHLIDQALNLFGYPDKLNSNIQAQRANSPVDDYFKIELEYPNLKVVLTAGMMVKDLGPRFILKGSKGTFTKYGIDPQEDALKKGLMPNTQNWGEEKKKDWGIIDIIIEDEQGNYQIETLPGNYMGFYDNVYDVIINNEKIMVKPEEARNVIKIIELAFKKNITKLQL